MKTIVFVLAVLFSSLAGADACKDAFWVEWQSCNTSFPAGHQDPAWDACNNLAYIDYTACRTASPFPPPPPAPAALAPKK